MKKTKTKLGAAILRLLLSVVLIFLLFYTMLPAINMRDRNFLIFLIISIVVVLMVNLPNYVKIFFESISQGSETIVGHNPITGQPIFAKKPKEKDTVKISRPLKIGFVAIAVLILWMVIATAIGQRFFNASRYRDLITLEDGDFTQDVAELQMSQIPVVDKDTAARLGSRKLGEMTELVSQFEIGDNYTQINYKGSPYRVTPLAYADPIKWLYNMKKGLPAYITVDMVTQETDLVWLEDGMKYSPSEYFFRNIYRYLRFSYPTKIFKTVSFEIDDNGVPYWVAPVVKYRIGWWDGEDISGAVLVNAVTGESQYYEKESVPEWIDQLYTSDLIIEQLDDNGKFQNGFINSIFGQRNVRRTTYGYNYLAMDDDVYLYTGMSSVTADESNIGFVLVNLRTKATKFYAVPGATEYSAMGSAEGQVQHLQYKATFPLLLNVSDRPAYFVSLKDAAGLVKMYAFVDVGQYQIVGTGSTVEEAKRNYRQALNMEEIEIGEELETESVKGTIDSIANVVVSGNTCYYFTLKDQNTVYVAEVMVYEHLPFAKAGDQIELKYQKEEEGNIRKVTEILSLKAE